MTPLATSTDTLPIDDWRKAWLASFFNPWIFATGVLGLLPSDAPNPDALDQLSAWQDKFLRNFFTGPDGQPCDDPRHSIRSGHGTGKGTLFAILGLWFTLTRYDSKAVITANSQDQLRDNNWPELKKWHRRLPAELGAQLQIDEERAYLKSAKEMAFLVRRTASKHNPEALQGLHAKYVLYLIDEASGIPDIVFEVAQGSLSTAGAMAVMASNPTKTNGFFFDTHHKLRHRWHTWQVNSEDVPRARGHIEDVIASYGRGSNRYRVRVLGEFPNQDDEVIIALDKVIAATRRDVQPLNVQTVWGVDVARFGDDESALAKRKGNVMPEPTKGWHGLDNMQLVGKLVAEWNNTPEDERPDAIMVDVIGMGSGVVDRLQELKIPKMKVYGVNVAESAATEDNCFRLRDELWWLGRKWFNGLNTKIPHDEKLISELTVPTYDFNSNGQIVAESKKDLKKRGVQSPNRADAFLNTFARPDIKKVKKSIDRDNRAGATGWSD